MGVGSCNCRAEVLARVSTWCDDQWDWTANEDRYGHLAFVSAGLGYHDVESSLLALRCLTGGLGLTWIYGSCCVGKSFHLDSTGCALAISHEELYIVYNT